MKGELNQTAYAVKHSDAKIKYLEDKLKEANKEVCTKILYNNTRD
jgi:hypothetical protein